MYIYKTKQSIFFILLLLISANVMSEDNNTDESKSYYDNLVNKISNTFDNLISTNSESKKVQSQINDITKFLDEYLLYIDDENSNNCFKRRFIFFKSDCRVKIDEILSDVEKIVFDDESLSYFSKIEGVENQINIANLAIVSLNETLIFAKTGNDAGFFDTSRDAIKSKIKNIENEIAILNDEILTLEIELQENLFSIGVNLTISQVQKLTRQLDGDKLLKIINITDVIKDISESLGKMMVENSFNPQSAKKYYGIYLLLTDVIIFTQEEYLNTIDDVYLPSIDAIKKNSLASIKLAKKMKRKAKSQQNRGNFDNNIAQEGKNIDVIEYLERDLQRQKVKIKNALSANYEKNNVALSSYLTSSNAANLQFFIDESESHFSNIISLQIPNIIPFDNKEMKDAYKVLRLKINSN
jgi:hypothetical protein